MKVEVLNVAKVQQVMILQGRKGIWIIDQLGLNRSVGYELLREGTLPVDQDRKVQILKKLSKLLGVDERQLLLRLEAKETA